MILLPIRIRKLLLLLITILLLLILFLFLLKITNIILIVFARDRLAPTITMSSRIAP